MKDNGALEIEQLSRKFLSCCPLKAISFETQAIDTWDSQEELIKCTVLHPANVNKPIKLKYQVGFLKLLIARLESLGVDVHDLVYESLSSLLLNCEVQQETCFKHYVTPGGIVSLEENIQIISQGTTGLNTWEAALVLSEWCIKNSSLLQDKVVLELGSGIGLVGLTIALNCRTRKIILSDCHGKVLDQLRRNIRANLNKEDQKVNFAVKVEEIIWENVSPLVVREINPDFILAADVVYDPELFPSLIKAIGAFLCAKDKKLILVCTQRNLDTLNTFLDLLQKDFNVLEKTTPDHQWFNWSNQVPIRLFEVVTN